MNKLIFCSEYISYRGILYVQHGTMVRVTVKSPKSTLFQFELARIACRSKISMFNTLITQNAKNVKIALISLAAREGRRRSMQDKHYKTHL